jgi:hypothetical protein
MLDSPSFFQVIGATCERDLALKPKGSEAEYTRHVLDSLLAWMDTVQRFSYRDTFRPGPDKRARPGPQMNSISTAGGEYASGQVRYKQKYTTSRRRRQLPIAPVGHAQVDANGAGLKPPR